MVTLNRGHFYLPSSYCVYWLSFSMNNFAFICFYPLFSIHVNFPSSLCWRGMIYLFWCSKCLDFIAAGVFQALLCFCDAFVILQHFLLGCCMPVFAHLMAARKQTDRKRLESFYILSYIYIKLPIFLPLGHTSEFNYWLRLKPSWFYYVSVMSQMREINLEQWVL